MKNLTNNTNTATNANTATNKVTDFALILPVIDTKRKRKEKSRKMNDELNSEEIEQLRQMMTGTMTGTMTETNEHPAELQQIMSRNPANMSYLTGSNEYSTEEIEQLCQMMTGTITEATEQVATVEPDEDDDDLNDEDETLQYKRFDFEDYSIDSVEIEEVLDSLDIDAVQLIDETQNAAKLLSEKVERLDNLQLENKNKEALYRLAGGVPVDSIKDILETNIYSTEDYIFRAVDHRLPEALTRQDNLLYDIIPCDYAGYTDIEDGAAIIPIEQVKDAKEHIIESINFYNFLSNCIKELYPEAAEIA